MKYLLRKGGYYYRPNSSGYTEFVSHAGIFQEDYALAHANSCDEVSAVPISDITEDLLVDIERCFSTAKAILDAVNDPANQPLLDK